MRRAAALLLTVALLPAALAAAACAGDGGGSAALSPQARALLATLPPAYRGADVANGAVVFNLCRSCHTVISGGATITGPNLHGLFGRKAASLPGYAYSSALQAAGWTWDADQLDRWIADPRKRLPGTKMTFVGLEEAKDRRDVIAYLRLATEGAAP